MVKIREIPNVERSMKIRTFVKIKDLFMLLKELLLMQKNIITHFALDIYIIILSGQRFLADHKQIAGGILNLLERNQNRTNDDL